MGNASLPRENFFVLVGENARLCAWVVEKVMPFVLEEEGGELLFFA